MIEGRRSKLFYGYVVVAAAFVIAMLVWGASRTFGVFLKPMLDEFGWTRAGISGAFTLNMIIMGLLAIVTGRLTDRLGPRLILVASGLILGSGYLLMSQISGIGQLYLYYGVILGVGLSGCQAPLMSVVARWFVKRRTLMSGILMAGPAAGIMLMPLVSSLLISAYGWRISYIVLGSVVVVVIVVAALFLKRDPSEMGLLPYGTGETEAEGLDLQAVGLPLKKAVHTRQFWLLNVVSFCREFLIGVVVVHIVIHATGLGVSVAAAASVLSVAAGASIPARVVMGGVADRIGNKLALTICLTISSFAFLLPLVAKELWLLYLFAALFGIGLWSGAAIMSPLVADLFGLKALGELYAWTVLVGAVGGAAGPVLAGYIFDVTGSYQLAFLMCVAVSVIAIVVLIFLKPLGYEKSTIKSSTQC